MTRTTADDVRALRTHAARHAVTGFPDGPVGPPDALHSRALAHGVGQGIAEAVGEAVWIHEEQAT